MVDTPALGAGGGNPVKVQILSSAPKHKRIDQYALASILSCMDATNMNLFSLAFILMFLVLPLAVILLLIYLLHRRVLRRKPGVPALSTTAKMLRALIMWGLVIIVSVTLFVLVWGKIYSG
jgi:hypothetical protein